MSSDFDFFAGQRTPPTPAAPAAPSAWAPAAASPWAAAASTAWAPPIQQDQRFGSTVGEWAPMSTAPTGQFAPAPRSSRKPLTIVAVLAVAAIACGAFYIHTRPHPVPLPAALAGLPKVSLPSAQAHELSSDMHSLRSDGVHDVTFGVYGSLAGGHPAFVVVAGRTRSTIPDFNQLASAVDQVGQDQGVAVTPQTLTSGASTFECATITSQGQSVPLCAWQGTHAVLLGFGAQISVQDTADALEQTRLGANLS
ncbi:MAG TPA: hypothetical protein VGD55_03420 [Acidothermaceae bacterium]